MPPSNNNTAPPASTQQPTVFPRVLTDPAFDGQHVALMTHLTVLQSRFDQAHPDTQMFSLVVTPSLALPKDNANPGVVTLADDLPNGIGLQNLLASLMPWMLGNLQISVATLANNGNWNPVPSTPVSNQPVSDYVLQADCDSLKAWLLARLGSHPPVGAVRAIHEMLTRSATSTFPYNFALQQAICFTVAGLPNAAPGVLVAAMPQFSNYDTSTAGATPVGPTNNNNVVGWKVGTDKNLQLPVAAYMQPVPIPTQQQAAGAWINFSDQRVRLADASASAGEQGDWLSKLPGRCGGLYDMPQRILDALAANAAPFDSPAQRDALWKWILATSRDLAGFGAMDGPSKSSLVLEVAHYVIDLLPQSTVPSAYISPDAQALAKTLKGAIQAYESNGGNPLSLAEWLALLKGQDPRNPNPIGTPVLPAAMQQAAALFQDLNVNWDSSMSMQESMQRWSRFISNLRNSANLSAIVTWQWQSLLANPPAAVDADKVLAGLSRVLASVDNPVRLLARGVIGGFWPNIIHVANPTDDPVAEIPKHAVDQFTNSYYASRNQAGSGFFPLPGVALTAAPAFFDAPAASAALFPEAAEVAPVRAPQPLVFQVGQVISSDPALRPSNDPLKEVAGLLFFMNQDGTAGGARCLNLGCLDLPAIPNTAVQENTLKTLVFAPRRLGYVNGASTANITYDNRSLVSRSAASNIHPQTARSAPDDTTPLQPTPRFVLPDINNAADRPKVRLPGLAYGRTFDVSCIAVLNAGILPKEIASVHPAVPDAISAAGFQIPVVPNFSLKSSYYRLVGIAAPSLDYSTGGSSTGGSKVPPPFQQQRDAAPLALELLAAQGNTAPGQEPPLALLYPLGTPGGKASSVEIKIHKAATDLENWDRWAMGPGFRGNVPAAPALRAKVRADFARARDNTAFAPSLDDPAVGDAVYVVARPIFPDPAVTHFPLSIPAPVSVPVSMDNPLRGTPIAVTISHGGTTTPAMSPGTGTLAISLPAGTVWEIDFYSVISNKNDPQIFDSGLFQNLMNGSVPVDADHVAVSPLRILVELATKTVPLWSDIYGGLVPSFLGRQGVLDIDRAKQEFAYLSSIEADLQVWNWSGRPVETFPFDAFASDPNAAGVQKWDAEGFCHRPDGACRTQTTRAPWSPGADGSVPRLRLFVEDRQADPRALYFRWSVRAYSRYPGLVPDPVSASDSPDTSTDVRWRRALLQAQPADKLNKPSLKLILPLGRQVVAKDGTACLALLAVFNDVWYNEAGLAEQLDVGIRTISYVPRLPQGGTGPAQTLLKAGHDPIVSTVPLPDIHSADNAPTLQIQPAVGHTFDVDETEPLVIGTSFNILLPPSFTVPASSGNPAQTVSTADWFMASITFRRTLIPQGVMGDMNAANANASDWTPPEWVQFTPPSDTLLPDSWTPTLQSSDGINWKVSGWSEPYLRSNPGNFDTTQNPRFDYWIVITRQAQDIRGQPSETYVGSLALNGPDTFTVIDPPGKKLPLTQSPGFVLRVLELRTRSRNNLREQVKSLDNPWKILFGETVSSNPVFAPDGQVLEDCIAQITRISAPVTVSLAMQ